MRRSMSEFRFPSPSQALTLLAAAQFSPLTVWAANLFEIGFPDGLLAWVGIVWLIALGLWVAVVRIGASPQSTTAVVFWFILGSSLLGYLSDAAVARTITILLLLVVFCGLVYRLRKVPMFHWLQTWVVLFVGISPIGIALVAWLAASQSTIDSPPTVETVAFQDSRDVVLIVFDGHGSYQALDQFYNGDFERQMARVEATGAVVVPEMMSNYTLTHLSLSSVFDMGYPATGGRMIRDAEWADLMQNVGGSNNLVRAFRSQGYRLVAIESGWAGFHCSSDADVCVGGPWPDEGTMLALQRTLLRPLVSDMAEAAARGAEDSLHWLESDLDRWLENDERDLIVVHIMLPHPPLRLDGACDYRREPGLGGKTVGAPYFTAEEVATRKAAYVEATNCASLAMSRLAKSVGDRAIFIAFGDHGPDSQGQLHLLPEAWDQDHVAERMSVLFVTNADCSLEGVESLVNVGRWLLGCMSGAPVDYLDDEYFIAIGSRRSASAEPEPIRAITPLVTEMQATQGTIQNADGS